MRHAGWQGESGKTQAGKTGAGKAGAGKTQAGKTVAGKTGAGKIMRAIEIVRALGLNAIGAVADRRCSPSGGSRPGTLLPTRRILA